jgi:hypothetical protein
MSNMNIVISNRVIAIMIKVVLNIRKRIR